MKRPVFASFRDETQLQRAIERLQQHEDTQTCMVFKHYGPPSEEDLELIETDAGPGALRGAFSGALAAGVGVLAAHIFLPLSLGAYDGIFASALGAVIAMLGGALIGATTPRLPRFDGDDGPLRWWCTVIADSITAAEACQHILQQEGGIVSIPATHHPLVLDRT